MTIYKDFTFDAAHRLPHMPPYHQCYQLHGHTYRVRVFITGPVDENTGMIMDYADIGTKVKSVLGLLDHHYLNEIKGLENPTTEVLIVWLWKNLKFLLPLLSKIEIHESSTTGCVYEGQ